MNALSHMTGTHQSMHIPTTPHTHMYQHCCRSMTSRMTSRRTSSSGGSTRDVVAMVLARFPAHKVCRSRGWYEKGNPPCHGNAQYAKGVAVVVVVVAAVPIPLWIETHTHTNTTNKLRLAKGTPAHPPPHLKRWGEGVLLSQRLTYPTLLTSKRGGGLASLQILPLLQLRRIE